jgi:hypothetical protein
LIARDRMARLRARRDAEAKTKIVSAS